MSNCIAANVTPGVDAPALGLWLNLPDYNFCTGGEALPSPCETRDGEDPKVAFRYATEDFNDVEFCLSMHRDPPEGDAQWGGAGCIELGGSLGIDMFELADGTLPTPGELWCPDPALTTPGVGIIAAYERQDRTVIPKIVLVIDGDWTFTATITAVSPDGLTERVVASGSESISAPAEGRPTGEIDIVVGGGFSSLAGSSMTISADSCSSVAGGSAADDAGECDFTPAVIQTLVEEDLNLGVPCPRPPLGDPNGQPVNPPPPSKGPVGPPGAPGLPAAPASGGAGPPGRPGAPGNSPPPADSNPPASECGCPFEMQEVEKDNARFEGNKATLVLFGIRYTATVTGKAGNFTHPIVLKGETPDEIVAELNAQALGLGLQNPQGEQIAFEHDGINPGHKAPRDVLDVKFTGGEDKIEDAPAHNPADEMLVLICPGRVNGIEVDDLPKVFVVPRVGSKYFILEIELVGDTVAGATLVMRDDGMVNPPIVMFDPPLPRRVPIGGEKYPRYRRPESEDGFCGDFNPDEWPEYPIGAVIDEEIIELMDCSDLEVYAMPCYNQNKRPFYIEWDWTTEDDGVPDEGTPNPNRGFWIYPGVIENLVTPGAPPVDIVPTYKGALLDERRKILESDFGVDYPQGIYVIWDVDEDDIVLDADSESPPKVVVAADQNEVDGYGYDHSVLIATLIGPERDSTGTFMKARN